MANQIIKIVEKIATPTALLLYTDTGLAANFRPAPDNFIVRRAHPGPPSQIIAVSFKKDAYDSNANAVTLQLQSEPPLKVGDLILVKGQNLPLAANGDKADTDMAFVRVNGAESQAEANARRSTQAFEESVAYPVMTENVGNPPSGSYGGGAGIGAGAGGGGSLQLAQLANQTITNVLGWKPKDGDAKGFVGALTQSFNLQDVEGHMEATWTPRTYAVQTDLAGGITGAQASLYMRAQDAMNQSLPLLNGFYALNPDSDPSMVTALKDLVSSQVTQLTAEMGYPGGPRIGRVNQYFTLLLGEALPTAPQRNFPAIPSDPDKVGGTVGRLRKELQLQSFSRYVNSVEDEQNITNYRIFCDYLTSLAQSWVNNLKFFGLDTKHAFLGSQLVLISRQLSVVSDTVDEVRFTLDSVFVGDAERQTLQLNFSNDPAMFIEDLLSWIQGFAKEEGPQLIQDSGKLGVGDGFLPIVKQLHKLVGEARDPQRQSKLPDGYRTIRVKNSLHDLEQQLAELKRLAEGVKMTDPPRVFDGRDKDHVA